MRLRRFKFWFAVIFALCTYTVLVKLSQKQHTWDLWSSKAHGLVSLHEPELSVLSQHIKSLTSFGCRVFIADLRWLTSIESGGFKDFLPTEITLGIFDSESNIQNLYRRMWQNFNRKVHILPAISSPSPCGFVFRKGDFTIFAVNFQMRGDYLYICDAGLSKSGGFGDTERAMDMFELKEIRISGHAFLVPRNFSIFSFMQKSSRLLRCNETAKRLLFKHFPNQRHNETNVKLKIVPGLIALKKVLIPLQKRYFIAAGTLLGWYRQCGIIEQAKDVDFGIFASEYDERVFTSLLANRELYIHIRLGNFEDGLQFRLTNHKYIFDLFVMKHNYRTNRLEALFQIGRNKYIHEELYFNETCSAELVGVLVHVPCEPLKYIEHEYGRYPAWQYPGKKTWYNVRYVTTYNLSFSECVNMRIYNIHGRKIRNRYFDPEQNKTVYCP